MRPRLLFLSLFVLAGLVFGHRPAMAQLPSTTTDPSAGDFRVYTSAGEPTNLDDLLNRAVAGDVVLIGETHDDSLAHVLELAILKGTAERLEGRRPVVLSLEMFERDVQNVVDEYLAGTITEAHFKAASRPWPNYQRDYRPLVEYAREHRLPVIAANAPRRYVNLVSRRGKDGLKDLDRSARAFLAPRGYQDPTEAYSQKWGRLMGDVPSHGGDPAAGIRMLEAQNLWDATMASAVASALKRHRRAVVVHAVGGFHVEGGSGMPDHLRRYRPRTRQLVVSIRPVEDPAVFDAATHRDSGDFVILTRAQPSIKP